MREIAVSKFKATCLAVLEDGRKTRQPIRSTKRGKPLAEIQPPISKGKPKSWLGCMRDSGEILGDIVSPTGALDGLKKVRWPDSGSYWTRTYGFRHSASRAVKPRGPSLN